MTLVQQILAGMAIWLVLLAIGDQYMLQEHLECAIVLYAALVLLPLSLRVLDGRQDDINVRQQWTAQLPLFAASIFLALGYLLFFRGFPYARLLTLPYLIIALYRFIQALSRYLMPEKHGLSYWIRLFALGYWVTGAIWAFCFVSDIRPLGFDPLIVSLTAAHFHVAGLVLSTAVYALHHYRADMASRSLGIASLFGMPLVAAGITLSKLSYSPLLEWLSAIFFAVYALGVALLQVSRAASLPSTQKYLLQGASFCLVFGAFLAALYGLRYLAPIEWVNIPNMKVYHGALNAIGFGSLSLWAWSKPLPDTSETGKSV